MGSEVRLRDSVVAALEGLPKVGWDDDGSDPRNRRGWLLTKAPRHIIIPPRLEAPRLALPFNPTIRRRFAFLAFGLHVFRVIRT